MANGGNVDDPTFADLQPVLHAAQRHLAGGTRARRASFRRVRRQGG